MSLFMLELFLNKKITRISLSQWNRFSLHLMSANLLGVVTSRLRVISEQHNTAAAFVIALSGWRSTVGRKTWRACVTAAYCETK